MQRRLVTLAALLTVLVVVGGSAGQELAPIALPLPQTDGGKPLMQALKLRATSRAFAPDPLPPQTLANLLWAAWGINRPAEGKRTAPSARNWQEIDVYAVMPQGVFLYDASAHRLKPVVAGDQRAAAGRQEFVREAPVTLVLVADRGRMKDAPADQVEIYASDGRLAVGLGVGVAHVGDELLHRGSDRLTRLHASPHLSAVLVMFLGISPARRGSPSMGTRRFSASVASSFSRSSHLVQVWHKRMRIGIWIFERLLCHPRVVSFAQLGRKTFHIKT